MLRKSEISEKIAGCRSDVHFTRQSRSANISFEIYFDDVLFSSILANQYREGLKSKGIHPAGLCAFDIDMTNLKLPNNQVKVEVIVQDDVAPLKGGEAYI